MADPFTIGTFALGALGAFGQHSAKKKAVKARNRERIMAYKEAQRQYKNDVIFKNNNWKNQVQDYKLAQQDNWQAMIDEWTDLDLQLDEIYESYGFALQKNMIESYQNSYAGEGTGVTASRLAGQALRKLGQQNAEQMSKLYLAEKRAEIGKERVTNTRNVASRKLWSEIWRSPVHGHPPAQPLLEKKPSNAGLFMDLAKAGLSAYAYGSANAAPSPGDLGPNNMVGNPFSPQEFQLFDSAAGWNTPSILGN